MIADRQAPIADDERRRLTQAADRLAGYPFSFWRYGDSIGFEGLLAASRQLGADRFEGLVIGALKAWAARAQPFRESDNSAAGHAMCLVLERTHDPQILEAATGLAGFLQERRLLQGVFAAFEQTPLVSTTRCRGQDDHPGAGAGVFVDCLHFDPPFFTHLGSLTGNRQLTEAGATQAVAATRLLQSPTGLFSHFWLETTQQTYGYGWGRGQGWALLGLVDTLTYLPATDPRRPELIVAVQRLAEALVATQDGNGGWSAIVTDPRSGAESSTAVFVAAGFAAAVELGLLTDEFARCARSAWEHAWSRVDSKGVLAGVSDRVPPSTDHEHHARIPTGAMVPWGQGPLLVAAARLSKLSTG